MVIRQTLKCGCMMEKADKSDASHWFVVELCQIHVKTYYKNTYLVLEELRNKLQETNIAQVVVGVGTCSKCGNVPNPKDIGCYKNDTTGEIICLDCALGTKRAPNAQQRLANLLRLLDEFEKAEQTNWETGNAMNHTPVKTRQKRTVLKAECMSRAWGRIQLIRQIRKMLTE